MIIIRDMQHQMRLFVLATFPAAALVISAALMGSVFVLLALSYMTVFVLLMDRFAPVEMGELQDPDGDANKISVILAVGHFGILFHVLWALCGDQLSIVEKLGLFVAGGLFLGQVSNSNAHELIHRPQRRLHRLGMWVYISLLFGHHTSAHVLVHHRHVATRSDPNTSRRGESFYRYAWRAWIGSFRAGYTAEAARLTKVNRPAWRNPYMVYIGGALLFLVLAGLTGGPMAVIWYVLLAGHAQMQLLMSDYVQHYGLTRRVTDGKPEPVNARHSWNSPHAFSSALMLNATRHSDHHAHPARPYPALTLPEDAPMLPKPLPLMATIALIPPLWRRIMDPAVDRWQHA